MGINRQRPAKGRNVIFLGILLTLLLLCGCTSFQTRTAFSEAHDLFTQGDYPAALSKYQQIIADDPEAGERVLFETGIIYAYSRNEEKDFQKSLDSLQQLINDYPESGYRKESELMIFTISNVLVKDQTIATQQGQIEALRQEVQSRGEEIKSRQNEIKVHVDEVKRKEAEIVRLKSELFTHLKGPAEKILIEKKERRLTLLARGLVLKSYRIALGGNPTGAKEKQGDNKTPEGTYVIDARNRDSHYHLSLHISYPNEKDKERARELGVSPGGEIMIHGIKNGFSQVGDLHTGIDWTKGCIAVTDEEIEEIERLAPNGTIVEIRAGREAGEIVH